MSTTIYTWNPLTDSVIEESDGPGNVLCMYTNEPSTFGPLISETRGGMTSYYHADALGSTRLTTNSSQAVVDSFLFDAWGNTVASTEPMTTPYQWCGRLGYQTDAVLIKQSVRDRSYQPSDARWSSVDPLVSAAWGRASVMFAPYSYVSNGPVTGSDPSGLQQIVNVTRTTDMSNLFLASNSVGGEDLTIYYVSGDGSASTVPTTIPGMNRFYTANAAPPGDLLDNLANFSAGWGDALTLNATSWLRGQVGINGGINPLSGYYVGGQLVGNVHLGALLGASSTALISRGVGPATRALTYFMTPQAAVGTVTTGLFGMALIGGGSTAWNSYSAFQSGNWNQLAFNAGFLGAGFLQGVSDARAIANTLNTIAGQGASTQPQTLNPLEYFGWSRNNFWDSWVSNFWGAMQTGPDPAGAGFAATVGPGGALVWIHQALQ